MKVLIIDDAPEIRQIARFSLTRFGGMEVLEAASGAEGLVAARTGQPDVILLDLSMPEMDGPEVLAALKADAATAAIPVVILSATAVDAGWVRALGARAALAKPFEPRALPQALRAALAA